MTDEQIKKFYEALDTFKEIQGWFLKDIGVRHDDEFFDLLTSCDDEKFSGVSYDLIKLWYICFTLATMIAPCGDDQKREFLCSVASNAHWMSDNLPKAEEE